MQLDKIQANIRLRNPWEAVDLGFAMIQTWWKNLFIPWVLLLAFIASIVWILTPIDYLWLAPFIIWWLKPIYDRLLLHILSHQLFSDHETTAVTLKKLFVIMKSNGLLSGLTYRRFSFSRGFNLPIWQLEKLTGIKRTNRQHDLHINSHSYAIWLTIIGLILETIINLSFLVLLFLFLPPNLQDNYWTIFFLEPEKSDYSYWIQLLTYCYYLVAVFIIEPFYVAGSFSLYLNRRTQLEAWDIELVFRHLGQRLAKLAKKSTLLLIGFTLFIMVNLALTTHVVAFEKEIKNSTILPAQQSKQTIEKIMQREELVQAKMVKRWRLKKDDEKKEVKSNDNVMEAFIKSIARILAYLFEGMLWFLVIIAIILLIIFRDSWLSLFKINKKTKTKQEIPDVLFGMDIRPEFLPNNIPATAKALWQQKNYRESLSLLYRGALARLVNNDNIMLENNHTEGDVLKLSDKKISSQRLQYLKKLTKNWREIAYAHQIPTQTEVNYLFESWENEFMMESTP